MSVSTEGARVRDRSSGSGLGQWVGTWFVCLSPLSLTTAMEGVSVLTLGIELAQSLVPGSLLNSSVTVGHCGRRPLSWVICIWRLKEGPTLLCPGS